LSVSNENKPNIRQLLDPDYLANPYPLYQQLRQIDPVLWDEEGTWVITSHEDVMNSLRDPHFSAQRLNIPTEWIPEELKSVLEPPIFALTRQMLFLDPPDHTRLRGLVSKAFTPRMIEKLRPRIQQIVEELLLPVQASGQMEVISEFAYPLPAIVIAEMLGVPREDRERFALWTDNFGRLLDGNEMSLELLAENLQGVNEFMEYFRAIIQQQRKKPQDNLLQAMIEAEEQKDVLSETELLGNCVLILAAGHGTTTHLIGNGLLALLRSPEQMKQLQANPALLPTAVAELLRYDSPVQITGRVAKEDIQIRDKTIKAGQNVAFVLGAANHDPAQFEQPDVLNVSRRENRHLAFGHGIHFCMGAPLARVEAEIAFGTFFKLFANPRLATETVEHFPSLAFRGLIALPITV
jgi:cytochrome P450